jgi:hypothetical protein
MYRKEKIIIKELSNGMLTVSPKKDDKFKMLPKNELNVSLHPT